MPNEFFTFWVVFNLCFLAFTIYIVLRVVLMEKKVKSLEEKLDKVYDFIGITIDSDEEHYNSLCNHIQTNREISLDIYDKVK